MESLPSPQPASTNIAKATVKELDIAPRPEPGIIFGVRTGKAKALGSVQSAIFKLPHEEPVFASNTGLVGDQHVYKLHGGIDRAINQYDPDHYAEWRAEEPPRPDLFDFGGFGENLNSTNLHEYNVCIGDIFRVGKDVLLQVSEPRQPCYKLNIRFEWPRMLKRVLRTGHAGWNYRVVQTGYIGKGDTITLVERPNPIWSVMNVQRVIRAKEVSLHLLEECSNLEVLTDQWRALARKALAKAPKRYSLAESKQITARVKHLTFDLREHLDLQHAVFEPYAFAQIRFGPDLSISRSYSIVSGDLRQFTLGIALDDNSRGGSAYLHKHLEIGDEIVMLPGANAKATEDDKQCQKTEAVEKYLVIAGGIGITAFLPSIKQWQEQGVSFEIHYAVRSPEDAAFLDYLPEDSTTVYATSRAERLRVEDLIPKSSLSGRFNTRIFCCGPTRLMKACKERADLLKYPEHLLHFEDFGSAPIGGLGDPFDVIVVEPETGRKETLNVPSGQTLLDVLHEAGFDVEASCRTGTCGACKVTLCHGKVDYKSGILSEKEKTTNLQSCVDRGVGKIEIEID